jgi:nucleoside-diphosphate-sugar epimerase
VHAGIQLTSISHVEDVASMMALAAGNRTALRQHYNACTDRTISLDGIARFVADALNKRANIVHYNVKDFDIPKGKGFPFRTVHFFASTDKAKHDLHWKPNHTFENDLPELVRLHAHP